MKRRLVAKLEYIEESTKETEEQRQAAIQRSSARCKTEEERYRRAYLDDHIA